VEAKMQMDQQKFQFRLRPPFFAYEDQRPIIKRCPTPGIRSYKEAAQDVPADIEARLRHLRFTLWNQKLPIALELSPDMETFPWEAVLSIASGRFGIEGLGEPFQFWRTARKTFFSGIMGDKDSVQTFAPVYIRDLKKRIDLGAGRVFARCGKRNWSLIQEGWEFMADRLAVDVDGGLIVRDDWENPDIIHVVGAPLQTGAGIRIQTSDGGYGETKLVQKKTYSRQGELIAPEMLPMLKSPVVILQAAPSEFVPYRTDTERETMGYLRQFASEVFALGAGAIVLLPPLPLKLSIRIMRKIADVFSSRQKFKRRRLVDLISELKTMILRFQDVPDEKITDKVPLLEGAGPREDLEQAYQELKTELANDVILYLKI
jgi:hypothetical protein